MGTVLVYKVSELRLTCLGLTQVLELNQLSNCTVTELIWSEDPAQIPPKSYQYCLIADW